MDEIEISLEEEAVRQDPGYPAKTMGRGTSISGLRARATRLRRGSSSHDPSEAPIDVLRGALARLLEETVHNTDKIEIVMADGHYRSWDLRRENLFTHIWESESSVVAGSGLDRTVDAMTRSSAEVRRIRQLVRDRSESESYIDGGTDRIVVEPAMRVTPSDGLGKAMAALRESERSIRLDLARLDAGTEQDLVRRDRAQRSSHRLESPPR